MLYGGRNLDVLSLWSAVGVDVPDIPSDDLPMFLPKIVCPNPNHDTFKRHFQINAKKPFVHCFAHCGISGSYEHAIATILDLRDSKGKLDDKAAKRVILRHTRTAFSRTPSAYEHRGVRKSVDADSEIAKDERKLNNGDYQFLPKHARAYLAGRGISDASRGKWQLGWDEDAERIVIPALDERGNFRFLIRRQVSGAGSLKYLYTKGTLKTSLLFGACYADRDAIASDGLILVEGSLDTISMHQDGFTTTCGILGTGISKKQVRIVNMLGPRRIYLFFDKDSAGYDNIEIARRSLTRHPLFVCLFPKDKNDPAEMTKVEKQRSIDRAMPISQFFLRARKMKKTREVVYVT